MFAANTRKSLKNLTWQEFVNNKVEDVDTWPYLPAVMLKQHLPVQGGFNFLTQRAYEEDAREAGRFVEVFSEKQKTVLSWIFASFIGVFGNLAVNLAFALPVLSGNIFWMVLVSAIVFALVVLYLLFLPKVSMVSKFIPAYASFPKGYEQHFSKRPCTDLSSNRYLSSGTLDRLVVEFGSLVQTAILKDSLNSSLKSSTCIHVLNVSQTSREFPMVSIRISTRGVKTWFDPRATERIRTELQNIVDAMIRARQTCSFYRYELDPKEWETRGCDFVDVVSQWKFEEVQNGIINALGIHPSRKR